MENYKRHKRNPLGQDVYLFPDGRVKKNEDSIIAVQRIWRERVYAPPSTIFEKRGVMYRKFLADWKLIQEKLEETHPLPDG